MALIGVVVAALALATATYAWFINNAAVGVEQLEFSATASTALSIAVHEDGKNITTSQNQTLLDYKGLLTNADIKAYLDKLKQDDGSGNAIAGLKAVSTVSTAGFFANDGFNYTEQKADKFKLVQDDSNNNYYLALPVWIRSSERMTVYLNDRTDVSVKAGTGSGALQYFDRAILLGFSEVPGAKDGTEAILKNVIYEPNEVTDDHGITNRKNTTSGASIDGYGIEAIDTNGIPAFKKQERVTSGGLFIATPEAGGIPTSGGIIGIDKKTELIQLEKDTPKKMMIYLWLDGMDFDCVDGISGSTLQVALHFIGVKP